MAAVNDDLELATLAAAVGAEDAAAAAAIPNAWNGALGTVDLSKPNDHVKPMGKLVRENHHLNVERTIVYYIWVAQNKPLIAVPITQEVINKVAPYVRALIARYRIYKLFHHCGADPVYRGSDMAEWTDILVPARQTRAAREIYVLLTTSEAAQEKLAEAGQFVLFSIVANAIHREQHDGHSWFSDELANPRSPTSKTLAVAGRLKTKFKDWMELHGHDGNHHLADPCLDTMAKALTGSTALKCELNMPRGGLMYAGRDVNGLSTTVIFKLGEAIKDRYPAGVLGKAALIIGMQMITAMMAHLSMKVKIVGVSTVGSSVEAITSQIGGTALDHSVMIRIGAVIGPTLSFVYGFVISAELIEESTYKAFANHAARYPAQLSSGKSLSISLKRASPHREALSTGVTDACSRIVQALASVAAVKLDDVAAGPVLCTSVPTVDTTKIASEVGAIGGGDIFYDA